MSVHVCSYRIKDELNTAIKMKTLDASVVTRSQHIVRKARIRRICQNHGFYISTCNFRVVHLETRSPGTGMGMVGSDAT